MLKFIDENDFSLVERWKQNDDGSIQWWFENSNGVIREGFTRSKEVQTGTETVVTGQDENGEDITEQRPVYETQNVDVWAILQAKISANTVFVEQKSQSEIDAQAAEEAKRAKLAALDALTVEHDGMVFQADEQSRARMASAITAAPILGRTTVKWRLLDNSEPTINIAQLEAALGKAMEAFESLILETEV